MKIAWSPTERDKFLTYSNNIINLYETYRVDTKPSHKGCVQLSDDLYATTLATASDVHLMKCVAWYPGHTPDSLVAIGQANGKVVLSNFGQNSDSELVGKEFAPKHLRHCTYLHWNPVNCNLLAEGLDKHRNDCCIAIWDVNTKPGTDSMGPERQRYSSTMSDTGVVNKPYIEIGLGETTSSFAWSHKEPRMFVTGINGKCLRIYDLRDVTKPHLIAGTKFVHGLCTDPQHDTHVASFSESQVSIWDVRSFDKPQLMLPCDRAIMKIDWCPTRTGFLAVLCRDSSVVKLYDIRHSIIGTEELEPVIMERHIQPTRQHAVAHFAWHPTDENRLLTVTPTGNLRDNLIFEKLSLSMSPSMHLTWATGKKIIVSDWGSEVDMAARIRIRGQNGYGLHVEKPWDNAIVVRDEPDLHDLWHWIDLSKKLSKTDDQSKPIKPPMAKYIGVQGILRLEEQDRLSDIKSCTWKYPEGAKSNSSERRLLYQFKSEERTRALHLCGWWYDTSDCREIRDPLNLFLGSLVEENEEYERAAAIAIFNLKIGKAVDILSSIMDGSPNLTTVAMALSGFTEERNALWRKTCANLRESLRDPYLRAMFAFLACETDNHKDVLQDDPCMAVKDRVAFACMYLNDVQLHNYLTELTKELKKTGNLDGILLTGLTTEGVDLLQTYVDLTADVQTASLAAVYSYPNEIAKDERVRLWIESYRELLDRWKLWHLREMPRLKKRSCSQRISARRLLTRGHREADSSSKSVQQDEAKFDIMRHAVDTSVRVPSQAFVSCNFCGKSVACNMTLAARSRPVMQSLLPSTHKPKITCCPGCRKPLPRCSLCLTNLGTPAGSALYQQKDNKAEFDSKLSSFDHWFTWCQSCRHGGHKLHIQQWFRSHVECPVTGCICRCMSLESASQLAAEVTTFRDSGAVK